MNLAQRDNDILKLVAPSGGVTVNVPVQIGNIVVIPQETALVGVEFAGLVRGNIYFPKKAGETWALTDMLYFDTAAAALTKTDSGALIRCAKPTEAVSNAAATSGWVLFDGGAGAPPGVAGDITGVTAGTGLTGGGTSGAVTVALSAGSIASLALADSATQQTTESAADERVMLQDGATGRKVKAHATLTKTALDSAVAAANAAIPKVTLPVAGDLPVMAADGTLTPSGSAPADFAPAATAADMAAVGGVDELLYTAAADRAVAKSGVTKTAVQTAISQAGTAVQPAAITNMVTNATGAASAANMVVVSAGADKTVKDGAIAISALPRVVKITVTNPADAAAHDTAYTLPAGAVVLDCWVDVTTADTVPGGSTVDIGITGTVAGFLNNVPLGGAGLQSGGPTLDGTNNWFASTTYGTGLAFMVAGANADDRGLFYRQAATGVGGSAVAYQASAGNNSVFDIYLLVAGLA